MNRSLVNVLWVLLMFVSLPSVLAQDSGWPRTLPLEQGMVTIYQPQVDEMNGDVIQFRAALAYRATADSEPVFGAGWFESRVEIKQSSRIVHPVEMKVTETRFPAGTDDVQSELAAVLRQQSANWNLDFSLDELQASLETAEAESLAAEKLNTAPPQVIYRDHPALLISMDGEPVLREIENSKYQAVINTPYPLIFNGRHYYLNAAKDVWYRAADATGPYQYEASPPADITAMVKADEPDAAAERPLEPVTAANAPEIIVSTEPAELIVTDGPAAFVPLVDDLLVLHNSDDDLFMHVSSQKYYIVLAGRWYQSGSLDGPWAYQPAEDLPAAFANIPKDSDQADSRVYVAGTEEARDAVLDAQVPQTAAVARGEVDIDVEYDGNPEFEPVDGADLVYASNTGSTVIQSGGLYYLVEDGVWYVSSTPNGPWEVSAQRPLQVASILPTSPVYNVKYVHIYDSTPDVVYVGYTPGYTGSYVYHNTIFYGSGWYYRPWVSPYYYYPRHSTWGFAVGYNPWTGWNFGLSWGWGPFSVGFYSGGYWHHNHYWHHRHYGHWGPRGYRPRHYGHRGYGRDRYGYRGHGRSDNDRGGNRRGGAGHGPAPRQRNDNLYRDDQQRARIARTRDNQPRTPARRDRDSRQAYNTDPVDNRARIPGGKSKAGRSRKEPIRPSEMRAKADVRDANFEARNNRLLADNNGRVYRQADRSPDLYAASGKNNRQRTKRPANASTRQPSQTPVANKPARQRSAPAVQTPVRQSQPVATRKVTRQQAKPATRAPVRQSKPATTRKVTRQQKKPAARATVRQSKPVNTGDRGRQRKSPADKPTVQRSQPVTNHQQARRQPSRVAQAPAQKQNRSQPAPQPRSSAPARPASHGATQKNRSQRNQARDSGRRGKTRQTNRS